MGLDKKLSGGCKIRTIGGHLFSLKKSFYSDLNSLSENGKDVYLEGMRYHLNEIRRILVNSENKMCQGVLVNEINHLVKMYQGSQIYRNIQ